MTHYYYDLVRYPTKETIKMITILLEKITQTNDKMKAVTNEKYRCFYAKSIPTIDIQSYLNRILKYCPCTNECFLGLLIYFDRLSRNSTGLRIDSFNIHRLIITGIMIANKFFSDIFYTNARYAKVGGLPIYELNLLELQFLKLNNFDLNIKVEELQKYGNQLLYHFIKESKNYKLNFINDKQSFKSCYSTKTIKKSTNNHNVSEHFESITKC